MQIATKFRVIAAASESEIDTKFEQIGLGLLSQSIALSVARACKRSRPELFVEVQMLVHRTCINSEWVTVEVMS